MNTVTTTPTQAPPTHWPLERILFAMAGTMTLLSVLLVALVSPWFLILTALVGVNQWLYVAFGACPPLLNRCAIRKGDAPGAAGRPLRGSPGAGRASCCCCG